MVSEHKSALERLADKTGGKAYIVSLRNKDKLVEGVKKDFDSKVIFDEKLTFTPHNIGGVISGDKYCTIRFSPEGVRLPLNPKTENMLDCMVRDGNKIEKVGLIQVYFEVYVSRAKDFPLELAKYDGFKSKREMIKVLSDMYRTKIQPCQFLSYYQLDRFFPA